MKRFAAAAALLAISAFVPAAHAAAGAQAGIADLTFTLVDLDPLDGIVPAYAVVNDPMLNRLRTELTADVSNTGLGTSDNGINASFSFIATLALDRAVVGNEAHASSSATGLGVSVLSQAPGHASAFASAESNLLFSGDFGILLTPHTALTVSGQATVAAFDQGQPGAEGHAFEFAQAESFLRLRGADPGDGSGPQDDLSTRAAQTVDDANADAVDASGLLSVSFQNLSGGDLFAYLSVRSTASAFGVTPIPEPPAWALVAAGLALLAGRRRLTQPR